MFFSLPSTKPPAVYRMHIRLTSSSTLSSLLLSRITRLSKGIGCTIRCAARSTLLSQKKSQTDARLSVLEMNSRPFYCLSLRHIHSDHSDSPTKLKGKLRPDHSRTVNQFSVYWEKFYQIYSSRSSYPSYRLERAYQRWLTQRIHTIYMTPPPLMPLTSLAFWCKFFICITFAPHAKYRFLSKLETVSAVASSCVFTLFGATLIDKRAGSPKLLTIVLTVISPGIEKPRGLLKPGCFTFGDI